MGLLQAGQKFDLVVQCIETRVSDEVVGRVQTVQHDRVNLVQRLRVVRPVRDALTQLQEHLVRLLRDHNRLLVHDGEQQLTQVLSW